VFCPSCGSEYRPGFTHCASCDVDLVEDPPATAPVAVTPLAAASRSLPILTKNDPMLSLCGFLSFEEAMDARRQLRGEGIRSEIVVREDDPSGDPSAEPQDTYWLRLSASSVEAAAALLGTDGAVKEAGEAEEDETVSCSECGKEIGVDETVCPHCGARFEE
jgi:predicted amidophosphoribosyltransferase